MAQEFIDRNFERIYPEYYKNMPLLPFMGRGMLGLGQGVNDIFSKWMQEYEKNEVFGKNYPESIKEMPLVPRMGKSLSDILYGIAKTPNIIEDVARKQYILGLEPKEPTKKPETPPISLGIAKKSEKFLQPVETPEEISSQEPAEISKEKEDYKIIGTEKDKIEREFDRLRNSFTSKRSAKLRDWSIVFDKYKEAGHKDSEARHFANLFIQDYSGAYEIPEEEQLIFNKLLNLLYAPKIETKTSKPNIIDFNKKFLESINKGGE